MNAPGDVPLPKHHLSPFCGLSSLIWISREIGPRPTSFGGQQGEDSRKTKTLEAALPVRNIGLTRPMRTLVTALLSMSGLAVGAAVAWADPIGVPATTAPVMAPVEVTPAVATAKAETVAAEAILTSAQIRSRQISMARTPEGARIVARAIIADKYQWSSAQFTCLDSLWTRESNWRYRANNKSSGAYGIPQAYPGTRMAMIAPDWKTNPVTQITWGLYYVNARYGTPCAAWSKFKADNWY